MAKSSKGKQGIDVTKKVVVASKSERSSKRKKRNSVASSCRVPSEERTYFYYRLYKGVTNNKDPSTLLNRQLVWLSKSQGNNTIFHMNKKRQETLYSVEVPSNIAFATSDMIKASIFSNISNANRVTDQDILVVDENLLISVNVSRESSSTARMMQQTSILAPTTEALHQILVAVCRCSRQ